MAVLVVVNDVPVCLGGCFQDVILLGHAGSADHTCHRTQSSISAAMVVFARQGFSFELAFELATTFSAFLSFSFVSAL